MEDVAEEAGLSKGIAFYYFKNREELLVSVLKKMWDNLMEVPKNMWEIPEGIEDEQEVYKHLKKFYSDPDIDLIAIMKESLSYIASWINNNPDIMKTSLEFWCEVPRNSIIADLNSSIQSYLRTISGIIIAEGIKRGLFKARDPDLAAYTLISSFYGFGLYYITNADDFKLEDLEKEFNNLVFNYLQP